MRPIIAIVGRPNVGKSTLFNRLVGRRRSLVRDVPGVTRDRLYGTAAFERWQATVVDTGGFDPSSESDLVAGRARPGLDAIEEADLIVFVVDGRAGHHRARRGDRARSCGRADRPVLARREQGGRRRAGDRRSGDAYRLGFSPVLTVSAEHGRGVAELLEAGRGPRARIERGSSRLEGTRVAIIGRPNVGKSSLVNAVLGHERVLVHDAAGHDARRGGHPA